MNKNMGLICLSSFLLCLSSSFGKVVFHDTFSSLDDFRGEQVELTNPSIPEPKVLTSNPLAFDGSYLLQHLEVRSLVASNGVPLYKKGIQLPQPGTNRFNVLFKFRHAPQDSAKTSVPPYFDLILRSANGRGLVVRIAANQIAGKPIQWNKTTEWSNFALKAYGKNAALYYSAWGPMKKLRVISLPFPCATVNFRVAKESGFDLGDFIVTTAQPLPRDPIENFLPDFKSLGQPIPNAHTVGPEGEEVSLSPSPRAGIRFSPGPGVSKLKMYYSTGNSSVKVDTYDIVVKGQEWRVLKKPTIGLKPGTVTNLPNAAIDFKGMFVTPAVLPCRQFVRPSFRLYQYGYMTREGYGIVRAWDSIPPAEDHPLDVDFIRCPDKRIMMALDGSVIDKSFPYHTFNGTQFVTNIVFSFAPGVRYAVKEDVLAKVDTRRFLPIDLSANPRANALARATACSLKPGLQDFDGIPINVAKPLDSADVALCRQGIGENGDESDAYLGRSPLDGYPASIHYRLPAAPYARAHVLFALDPDPSKDPVMTVRMSHYINTGCGANMLVDTVVDLSDGKIPADYEKVGTIVVHGKKLPVYRAAIDLNIGNHIDITTGKQYDGVCTGKYLEFEFLGRKSPRFAGKPDPDSRSAFNILGVTLEKMPFDIDFTQVNVGNVFNVDETKARKTSFVLTSLGESENAKGTVAWKIRDVDGKVVSHDEKSFTMGAAGSNCVFDVVLDSSAPVGYYPFELTITTPSLPNSFTHNGAFAVLPPAARMVDKYDSPYGIWNFGGNHGSPRDPAIGASIMQKAGIVRSGFHKPSQEEQDKYNLTTARFHKMDLPIDFQKLVFKEVRVKVPDPENPGKEISKKVPAPEAAEIKLRQAIEKDPTITTVMLWHEDAPSYVEYGIPTELLGMPMPEFGTKGTASAMQVNAAGEIVRRVSEQTGRKLRLQIGNSTTSIGAVVWPIRQGAKPEYYDDIGIETPSQSIPPESLDMAGLQAMVVTREIADYYIKDHHADLTGCYEFTVRCERDIGGHQLAEWYMRDILVSLANRFKHISPGLIFDCKNSYYDSIWGAAGMLGRNPYCYPKEAYVAYAVLTSVLDDVKLTKQRDTGSTTVYALEFNRADDKVVTALWAARGEVRFSLETTGEGTATHMLGAVDALQAGTNSVWGGTSPMYVVTDEPLKSISIAGRTFREDESIAGLAQVSEKMDDINGMTLEPDKVFRSYHKGSLPILMPSNFTFSQVDDPEKGACIEVTLGSPYVSPGSTKVITTKFGVPVTNHYVTEYTTIRFKEPKEVPGEPVILGVWVKGNSNWGKIRFEIEDAKGEVFKNRVNAGQDWPCNLAVNFDGWSYVYAALTENSFYKEHSIGPERFQWISDEGPLADHVIDYPIKVRAITIPFNRNKLDLLDFKPSAKSIRLCNIGGTEEPAK